MSTINAIIMNTKTKSELSTLFSSLFTHYKRSLTMALKARGYALAAADIKLLGYLHQNPGASMQKLATVTVKDKAQITRKVRELEGKKLIYRQKDAVDNRSYQLFLTPEGAQLQTKTMAIRAQVLQQLSANLTVAEQKKLHGLLSKCLRDFSSQELND